MRTSFSSFLSSQLNHHSLLPEWTTLQNLATEFDTDLKALFKADSLRAKKMSIQAPYLFFDYSKQKIDDAVFEVLLKLAEKINLDQWIQHYLSGSPINFTENRSVSHNKLRLPLADAQPEEVKDTLLKMKRFVDRVRSPDFTGFSGKPITNVICIGVGGSHLGPEMILNALSCYQDSPFNLHFVSNADGVQLAQTLKRLNPETTLFIVSSKTFTTAETRLNAESARNWFLESGSFKDIQQHFFAVTSHVQGAVDFGIDESCIFPMWDWVGGRFSLWSAIGLPIALGVGFDHFESLLKGANAMDSHFEMAPFAENAPVIAALVGFWNATFLKIPSLAILPYDQSLSILPAYLQQAEMESNGKSTRWDGSFVNYPTCPIIWGQLGINGQHAFYQLLHQGTHSVAMDFIASILPVTHLPDHHPLLFSNAVAQSQAFMEGVDLEAVKLALKKQGLTDEKIKQLSPHKVHLGNKPSNFILLEKISPESIGALIAFYEHKIFVQGILWQVCSFDQWGVELGKVMAKSIEASLKRESTFTFDASTDQLISKFVSTYK